jgi:hypothetical protein
MTRQTPEALGRLALMQRNLTKSNSDQSPSTSGHAKSLATGQAPS